MLYMFSWVFFLGIILIVIFSFLLKSKNVFALLPVYFIFMLILGRCFYPVEFENELLYTKTFSGGYSSVELFDAKTSVFIPLEYFFVDLKEVDVVVNSPNLESKNSYVFKVECSGYAIEDILSKFDNVAVTEEFVRDSLFDVLRLLIIDFESGLSNKDLSAKINKQMVDKCSKVGVSIYPWGFKVLNVHKLDVKK